MGLFQLRQKFRGVQAHHSHAVFQLVKVLVELLRRDGPACFEIPFIAGIDDALAVAALALIAEFFHDVDDLGTGGCVVGRLPEQLLAVVRHAAGHRSDALHHGGQLQQVAQGTAQLITVVDAAAEHQLTVNGDAALHQTGQVLEHLAAALVGQHPHTELRVRGVHRNVDGRDVHLDDAVDLVVLHVRHGDIVAEQKGEPLVVVLEVKALPHSGRQLVDEAEHTVVGAGVLLVAQIGLEIAAKGAALRALHVPLADAVCHPCFQVEAFAVGVEIVVQTVVQLVLIHAQKFIACSKAQRFRFAAGVHPCDLHCHRIHLLFLYKRSLFRTNGRAFVLFTEQEGEGMRPPLLYITPLCHQLRAN